MTDWITRLIEQMGYFGIALLMFLENLFPPLPSEVIMPLAGFTAGRGELDIVGVLLAGTAGTLSGALFWYGVARSLGEEQLKRWALDLPGVSIERDRRDAGRAAQRVRPVTVRRTGPDPAGSWR